VTALPPSRARALRALLLWLVALACGAVLIARAQFSADLSAFLPRHPDAEQRLLIEQLHNGVAARTLLLGIEGRDAAQRAQASRALASALRASGLFEQVANGAQSDWQSAGQLLLQHRYQLSPAVTPEHFSVAGLRDAIDDTLSLLGTPAGEAVRPLLERDPTGETARIAEGLIPAQAPRVEQGVWVSRTAPRALLLLTTRANGADLDAQQRAIDAVQRAFAPQAAQGLRLQMSGAPVFAVHSRARIEREASWLGGAGLVLVGALLLVAFGSLRALAVAMLPVGTGVVAGIAAVAAIFGTVHGLTLAFGSTLIGEAVDYAIYYLIQAHDGGWQRWRERHWPTVRLGVLTSVCGFSALVASGFPGLAQLGVFSIAGLVAAALTTRFVLSAIVPAGAAGEGLRRRLASVAQRTVALLQRLRLAVALLGLVALIGLAFVWGGLWQGDLASLSPVPAAAQRLDGALRADLGASDARTLVVASGASEQAALQAAEAAGARLDALVDQGRLAGYDTPTRLLPSLATQQRRVASLPDADTLRARLAPATQGLPLHAAQLAPFVADVQAARRAAPVTRAALAGTPLQPVVDALLLQREGGGWSALLPLDASANGIDAARLRAALAGLPGVQVLDIKQQLDRLYASYLQQALWQSALGALAVIAVVAWQLRSPRRVLAVCQPLVLAVLFTMAGLAWAGVTLGILHLVGLLLVVAVGSNYGLFFDRLGHADAGGHEADADTLASLLLANATAVVAFGLLAFSQIPALSAIGRVVAPGALLALWLSAVFSRPRERG
jgi:predicted exporter